MLHVVGARPNFMKVAPVMRAMNERQGIRQLLVHTGQHYDRNMSDVFFDQLEIPEPDLNLEVGSATHAQQTAEIMRRFEPVVDERKPDLVFVYGDVNSTAAATLVCAKLGVPVAHVEAGLRSFDRTMPEEINRLVTDQLATLLLTPSQDADENLEREGIAPERVYLVGNVMIDTLVRFLPVAEGAIAASSRRGWVGRPYVLVTLHRPSNVDDPASLRQLCQALGAIARDVPVLFPVHPRTQARIRETAGPLGGVEVCDPLGYFEFLALQRHATAVITDSGGIQEETTYLGVPCLTMRENTERPVTVTMGTNILIGRDTNRLQSEVKKILSGEAKRGRVPELWDGHASERIAGVVCGAAQEVTADQTRSI
ncbi:MAG TPA: UDP-N-acetylglucosamine 2-epimerase (non-hydrolyzing) [Thermoanaerobaculia bacterium]|nr:UDP-N-acetylglucosamine 2-epimerase (non-hydrolyzing) [Thermoanaerobaculia bacterium]